MDKRELDPFYLYIRSIKAPLLTREQESELFQRLEHGDKEAGRILVESNLRLVFKIARRYENRGVPLLDLVQEGNIALMHAIEKFEWRRGFKLSTYATDWIRASMGKLLIDDRPIRLPLNVGQDMLRALRVRDQLTRSKGCAPTLEEVAAELEDDPERVEKLLELAERPASLDEPHPHSPGASRWDRLESPAERLPELGPGPDELAFVTLEAEQVEEWLAAICPRRAKVLRLRYGVGGQRPHTLTEASSVLGISRSRVQQLEHEGMKALRRVAVA